MAAAAKDPRVKKRALTNLNIPWPPGGQRSIPKSWPTSYGSIRSAALGKRADRQEVIAIYARGSKILLP
jgi:hypothetical protein